MQIELELLAPAKNKDIGIAAIDCGADAIYIAGPRFGAREAAGNTIPDIAELARYAHAFGAKVYMTVNTILYDSELEQARETICGAYEAGVDAIIVQDLSILGMDLPPIQLHASTQTNIRTPQQAAWLESLGFSRLILARELSFRQISEISAAVHTPLEGFVHGALCVSYSGQCYLSQKVSGRSANRGCCAQACRSNYTLIDATGNPVKDSRGNILVKDSPILSLKDLNLSGNIPQLVEAGITSFKIEGRLKNESYIRNSVLLYRRKIDEFLEKDHRYRRASFGTCRGGFTPNPEATFNRGYTTLFATGNRGKWNSADGAKYLGEFIGKVSRTGTNRYGQLNFTYTQTGGRNDKAIANGDGLCFVTPKGEILGARANACNGNMVATTEKLTVPAGTKIFRNYNIHFERDMEKNPPLRQIGVTLDFTQTPEGYLLKAVTAEGIQASLPIEKPAELAKNAELAKENIRRQLGKSTGRFSFSTGRIGLEEVPFFPVSAINGIRREIARRLDSEIEKYTQEKRKREAEAFLQHKAACRPLPVKEQLSYLANCSNTAARSLYAAMGARQIAPAYEVEAAEQAELMRTKYCIKYELGLCPNYRTRWAQDRSYRNRLPEIRFTEPLYIVNGPNRLELKFDCAHCEMLVIG